jgi:hypothetical protein
LFDIGIITNEDFLFAPIFLLIAEGGGVGDADVKNIFIVNCNDNDRGEWQYNDPKKLFFEKQTTDLSKNHGVYKSTLRVKSSLVVSVHQFVSVATSSSIVEF